MGNGDGPEGNLQDSISFTLTNFVEMNKLWVRLQHQGHSRERDLRTQERKELQLLVGNNLVRLSHLVELETYKNVILQPLLEQVVQCRDVLAQEYLLEVITQVFPDEFHLHTLDQFLAAVSRLNPHVNVKVIVIALMDRLSEYAARASAANPSEDREKLEEEAIANLLERVRVNKEKKPEEPAPSEPNGEHPGSNGTNEEAGAVPSEPATDGAEAPKSEETPADPKPEPINGTDGTDEKKSRGIPENIKLYEIFFEQVMNLVNAQHLPIQDTTALLVSLANLALNIYPDRLDYVDQVLEYANQKVKQHVNSADLHSPETQTNLLNLLLAPMKSYVSLFTALSLPTYVPLLHSQTYPTRRAVAGEVARSLQRNQTKISTLSALEGVLEILKVLIKEGTQQPAGYPGVAQRKAIETDETIEEQGWLARIVHLIYSDSNDTQFKLLSMTKKAYSEGNERIKFTTPALITSAMKLARRFKSREHYDDNWESQLSALYKFMHQSLSTLRDRVPTAAELCIRQFVACGQIADQTGPEAVSYEFFVQAFTIYEEQISDSRAQFQAVCIIAGALHDSRNFSRENYDALITKCAQHGSKLLKKPDQCRAVYLASHLWWAVPIAAKGETEDEKEVRSRVSQSEEVC
jgi:vacuolar protein sorting-associated protein 35